MRIWSVLLLAIVLSSTVYAQDSLQVKEGIESVYTASYEKGVEDAYQLAKTSEIEDQWVYSDGIWYDIGYDQDNTSVGIDFSKVRDILIGKKSVMMHIHPDQEDDRFYPPSKPDLELYAKYKLNFNYYPNTELKAIAITPDGVWSYDLSEEATRLLNGRGFEGGRVNRPRIDLINRIADLEKLTISNTRNFDEMVREYIIEAEKLGIYLTYNRIQEVIPNAEFSKSLELLNEPSNLQQSIPQINIACLTSEDLKYKCEARSPFTLIRCIEGKWASTNNEFSSKDNCINKCKEYKSNCLEVTPFYRFISYAPGLSRFSQESEDTIKNNLEEIQNTKGIRIMLRITNRVEKPDSIFTELKLNEGPQKEKNILILYNILDLRGAVIHSKYCNTKKLNEILKSDDVIGELKKDTQPTLFPTEQKDRAFINAVTRLKDVLKEDECASSEDISSAVSDFLSSLRKVSIEPKGDVELRSNKVEKLTKIVGKALGSSDESIKELSERFSNNIENNVYSNLLLSEVKSLNRRVSALKNRSAGYNILEFVEKKYKQSDLEKEKLGVEIIQKCLSYGITIKEIEKGPNNCYSKKGIIEFLKSLVGLTEEINYALKYNPRVLYILETERKNSPFPNSCETYFNVGQKLEKEEMYDKAVAAYHTTIVYCNRYGYIDISNRADKAVGILNKGSFGKGLWESAKSLTSPFNVGLVVGTITISYVAPPLASYVGGEAAAIIAARAITTTKTALHTYFLGTVTVSLSSDLGECTVLGIKSEECGKAVGDATFLLALISNTPSQIESIKNLKTEIQIENKIKEDLNNAIKKTKEELSKDVENERLKILSDNLESAKNNKYATILAAKLVRTGAASLDGLTMSIDLEALFKNTETVKDSKLTKQISEELSKAEKENVEPVIPQAEPLEKSIEKNPLNILNRPIERKTGTQDLTPVELAEKAAQEIYKDEVNNINNIGNPSDYPLAISKLDELISNIDETDLETPSMLALRQRALDAKNSLIIDSTAPTLKFNGENYHLIREVGRINKGFKIFGNERIFIDIEKDTNLQQMLNSVRNDLNAYRNYLKNDKDILDIVISHIREKVPYNYDLITKNPNMLSGDHYVGEVCQIGGGVCRHQGLIAAALVERLIDEGYLKGTVVYKADSHAWAIYKGNEILTNFNTGETEIENNQFILILDPAQQREAVPESTIYNAGTAFHGFSANPITRINENTVAIASVSYDKKIIKPRSALYTGSGTDSPRHGVEFNYKLGSDILDSIKITRIDNNNQRTDVSSSLEDPNDYFFNVKRIISFGLETSNQYLESPPETLLGPSVPSDVQSPGEGPW